MRGGRRNGSRITRRSSSAKRVRITSALKSVPTATNPSVASAMTPTRGSSTRLTETLKNRTNNGRPTASTTATNARFAISLPQYRLVRLSGDTSSPSSAWFSSSSWNARFSVSIAAKVNVNHRTVGARSRVGTAVGSRPKLNSVRTSAVNTTAETSAVRVRSSSTRSLRATAQAWRSSSAIAHRPSIGVGDLRHIASTARREMDDAAAPLESHVRRELDPFVHVMGGEHERSSRAAQLAEQDPQLGRCSEVQPRERLVEQQHARVVDQRARDRGALREAAGERPHRPLHADRAPLRPDQARENLDECRLAGAVRSEDGKRLSRREHEGHVVEGHYRPVNVSQSFNREHRCARRDHPCRMA